MNAKRIANNLAKKIENSLSIFETKGTKDYRVSCVDEGNWMSITIRNTDRGWAGTTFCSVTLKRIIDLIAPYEKKYDADMYWVMESIPTDMDKHGDWVYQPCMTIKFRKDSNA